LVGLHEAGQLRNEFILVWMNRLSDYLWLMARIEEGTSTPVKE
jgi:cob(I)alamin adenosyltransferase